MGSRCASDQSDVEAGKCSRRDLHFIVCEVPEQLLFA
jgi:hypothetical protein